MKTLKILPIIIAMTFLSSCSSWTLERYFYEHQRTELEAEKFLPERFSGYNKVTYDHDINYLLIFLTETVMVKVQYPEDFYSLEKENVNETYSFLAEPVKSEWYENEYLILATEFECGGFDFRVVSGGEYPKKFGMIGFCDETCEIAYLWFYDTDCDVIGDSQTEPQQAMREFVDYNFKL